MSAPDPAKKKRRAWRDRAIMTRVEFIKGPLDGAVGDVPIELEFATLEQLRNFVAIPDPDAPQLPGGRKADLHPSQIGQSADKGRYARRQHGEGSGFEFYWLPDEEF